MDYSTAESLVCAYRQLADALDDALLSSATTRWRKVAMVVGLAMSQLEKGGKRVGGIPDVLYAQRAQCLVEAGRLEAAGNLAYMRSGEVRIPRDT